MSGGDSGEEGRDWRTRAFSKLSRKEAVLQVSSTVINNPELIHTKSNAPTTVYPVKRANVLLLKHDFTK